MSDLISRQDAISIPVLPKEHRKKFNSIDDAFETGWNEALACVNMLPSAETDMSEYCDRLWKIAYERGKDEAVQGWIPVEEVWANVQPLKDKILDLEEKLYLQKDRQNGEWIPVSERLPSEPFGCIVTVWDSTPTGEGDDFENILPYFVGWDGEQWNDEDGKQCPFEIIAWMPLPKPYKGGDDE